MVNNTLEGFTQIPSYCIQPEVLLIFSRRFSCLTKESVQEEFTRLQYLSTSEYLRSHELLSHEFFVNTNNPYKKGSCEEAEFEYIPLLPLHWIATSANVSLHCTYAALIEDIVTYIKWLKSKEDMDTITSGRRPRFSVASTFNLRTAMGTGMPTPHRRGDIYDMVTLFVTTISLGHYERWPQCPDLLRKSWKYVMELPYIPLHHSHTILDSLDDKDRIRKNNFLFTGRLLLWGPERVCSIRNSLSSLAGMNGMIIVNVTENESNKAPNPHVFRLMQSSIFCIIAKADSYSTASFYSALHAGCIPIVISDWFVFSYPWTIPYADFVIRVLEEDFLKNPKQVIDYIEMNYIVTNKYKTMQTMIQKWIPLLSFEFLPISGMKYKHSRELIFHSLSSDSGSGSGSGVDSGLGSKVGSGSRSGSNNHRGSIGNINDESLVGYLTSSTTTATTATTTATTTSKSMEKTYAILPFELMLLELRYAQRPESMHKAIPCAGPFKCTWNGATLNEIALNFKHQQNNKLIENRSHLCKHVSRLIGHYKIVYFMQCVRILWPLTPGKLIKADLPAHSPIRRETIIRGDEGTRDETVYKQQLDSQDLAFVLNFHALTNLSKTGQFQWTTYPKFGNEKHVKLLHDFQEY